jgi:ATP dependent DNA ligase domain
VIAGGWDGDVTLGRELLKQVCAQWPTVARPHCLVTCGAFLRFAWPEGLLPGNFLAPNPETVEGLRDAAERVVRDLLESDLVLRLRQVTKYLTLGVDSPLRNKVTTTANQITSPHVELVCVVDLGSEPFRLHWTGKSYPTNSQADRLVRITDLTSHFTKLGPIGEVLILGCHDLTMFNPRARANAQGWRPHKIEKRKHLLAKLLKGSQLSLVLNEHFEEDGATVYRAACQLGCEGIVSKRLGSPYRSGRSSHWVKVKNPKASAVKREAEEDWS